MVPQLLTLIAALLASVAAAGVTSMASPEGTGWAVAATIGILAAVRPSVGLLLVAAFAPLGGAIAALWGLRTSSTDPLIWSAVAGWLLRRTVRPERWDAAAAILIGLMALTVCVSLAVQCAVTYQVTAPDGLTVARAIAQWLGQSRQALASPQGPEVSIALRLLAGCGLFAMSVEVCRGNPTTANAALRLLTLGVASVAVLNVNRFVEVALRQGPDFLSAAARLHQSLRVSSTIRDVNAVGALFVLVLPVSVALCLRASLRGWAWGAVVVMLGAGVWLSGSRAALAGGLVGGALYLAMLAYRRWTWRRTVTTLLLLLAVLSALVVWHPRASAHAPSHHAWVIRQQLAIVGFRMAREAPLFGLGVGRFVGESARLATPALRRYYSTQNAHNQFIQFLGELGIVGAGLFLGVIGCSLIPGRQAGPPTSPELIRPMIAGVVGFLAASLLMHPLLMSEVAAAFWIALGAVRSTVAPCGAPAKPWRVSAAVGAVLLLVTVPARVGAIRDTMNLEGVGIGLSHWRVDPVDQRRYRRARGTAAIYIHGDADRLKLALRGCGGGRRAANVSLWLDGRHAGTLVLECRAWTDLAMVMPPRQPGSPRFRRLEFRWAPVGRTARLDLGRPEYEWTTSGRPSP